MDEVLIEVSNDNGDHTVISVPRDQLREVQNQLSRAGVRDETMYNYRPQSPRTQQRYFNNRDHSAYTQYSDAVVNPTEDLEDNFDMEYDLYV